MKRFNYLLSAILVLSMVVYAGCGPDDTVEKTAAEIQLDKLKAHSWKATTGSVTKDGGAESSYDTFTLSFTGTPKDQTASGSYATTNGGEVFPSGTWSFDGTTVSRLVRGTSIKMDIQSVTDTNLKIAFSLNADGSANGRGLSGNWVFDLTAN